MTKPRTVCIIQARMGSQRLPGKVMKTLAGHPVLWHVVQRVRAAGDVIDEIVVATSALAQDNVIAECCAAWNVACFRGDESDVLERYHAAAQAYHADRIIRITADCPLLDPDALRTMLLRWDALNPAPDYMSNTLIRTFPKGLDIEIFTKAALDRAAHEAADAYEREHVTPYIYRHSELFGLKNFASYTDLSHHRWTLDTEEDYVLIRAIYDKLYEDGKLFMTKDIMAIL